MKGLNKERLEFWSCGIMFRQVTDSLQRNKEAIEGAIHSSWILHKSRLLELQAVEIEEKAKTY